MNVRQKGLIQQVGAVRLGGGVTEISGWRFDMSGVGEAVCPHCGLSTGSKPLLEWRNGIWVAAGYTVDQLRFIAGLENGGIA